MFTGIVDHKGTLDTVERGPNSSKLCIRHRFGPLEAGESVSVGGTCLTVTDQGEGTFWCELSQETLNRSTAPTYSAGDEVNLERALCLGDRMGGHWVTGHVDRTGQVQKVEKIAEFTRIFFSGIPESAMRYLVPKGSVTVDGVSLTVNEVSKGTGLLGFDVMLIPHTLDRTTLGRLMPGASVNLEWDWMLKAVVHETERLVTAKEKL